MKITAIKQQINRADRFSVFVDNDYSFSLGESALLKSKLVVGLEVTEAQAEKLKQLSANDVLYEQAQRYAAGRLHSRWEMSGYLQRKGSSPSLAEIILNKLSDIGLLDDEKFAKAFVADRQRLRPTSRRKITFELRAKHIPDDIIKTALGSESEVDEEQNALRTLIQRKRQQMRYQDDTKLTQYLVRQGFNYGNIKAVLKSETDKV